VIIVVFDGFADFTQSVGGNYEEELFLLHAQVTVIPKAVFEQLKVTLGLQEPRVAGAAARRVEIQPVCAAPWLHPPKTAPGQLDPHGLC